MKARRDIPHCPATHHCHTSRCFPGLLDSVLSAKCGEQRQQWYALTNFGFNSLCMCAGVQCAHALGEVCILCGSCGQWVACWARGAHDSHRGHDWSCPQSGAVHLLGLHNRPLQALPEPKRQEGLCHGRYAVTSLLRVAVVGLCCCWVGLGWAALRCAVLCCAEAGLGCAETCIEVLCWYKGFYFALEHV